MNESLLDFSPEEIDPFLRFLNSAQQRFEGDCPLFSFKEFAHAPTRRSPPIPLISEPIRINVFSFVIYRGGGGRGIAAS